MCGRYTLFDTDRLRDRFDIPEADIHDIEDSLRDRYNIGPSQVMPIVTMADGSRHMGLMRWGFIPPWSRDARSVFRYKTFNARSEDIFHKPLWRHAILSRRCLVPSTGFYEWRDTPDGKQPYFIRPTDQDMFAFAGIYGYWKDSEGAEWGTYSILTTTPNTEMRSIHNRMPVILRNTDEAQWLDPSQDSPEPLQGMMRPYPDGHLDIFAVSRNVNTTRVDDDTLVLPLNPS